MKVLPFDPTSVPRLERRWTDCWSPIGRLDSVAPDVALATLPTCACMAGGIRGGKGVAFAGNGFDEGGFSAAVGAEDGDVFTGSNGEAQVAEGDVSSLGDTSTLADPGVVDDLIRNRIG